MSRKQDKNEYDKTKKYKVNNEDEGTKKYKVKKGKESKKKGKKKKHPIIKRIILTIFVLGILTVLILAGIVAGIFFSDKFKLTEDDLKITNINGVIKDKDEKVIGTISGDEKRKIVTFDDMPEYLPKAFVAIEDKRFYEHKGVDLKRTTYATLMYAVNKGESSAGGGSTITQQLIKNLMDDKANEGAKGIERKIREMARAYNVEKILSKDQILELYLNKIFMGSTVYGVGMASEYYFSKPVKELDLAQCAFLAGINHTPNSYNPFDDEDDNSDIIKKRTKEVLYQMKDQGYIKTDEEYNKAVEEVEKGLEFKKGDIATKVSYSYHTAAAIKDVIRDLAKEKDVSEETAEFMFYNNGYTVYTTQDSDIQKRMEEEFLKTKYIKSGRQKDKNGNLINNHTQAAMVIIDHNTGKVVATVGGLGSDSNSIGTNRATQGSKQTGSSIKPIACEAPALEKGIITAGTVYDDSPTNFGGGYAPHNSSHYSGLVTIRTALAESSNIVHVKIMKEVGPENAIKFLGELGINVDSKFAGPSLALGTPNVSPLNMAGAYATIANDGEYITPIFYTKVEDSNGKVVLESKQEKRRVMSTENAYILKDLLTAPVKSGTATVCSMSNMDVGAKTGSTDSYINRWLCGFTPYYTAATWFGFDIDEKPVFSTNNAANIWAAVMKDVHKSLKSARFQKPSNVVSATICQESGCIATDSCTKTKTEVFVKGKLPKKCEGHEKLTICKETGKIATEFCTDVEEKTYTVKPEKENTKLWNTSEGDKYTIPTDKCDVHTEPEKKQINVPSVVGKKSAEAKKQLETLGLKVQIEYTENKNQADGVVIRQSIAKNTTVDVNTTITIIVNKLSENKTDENKTNTNTTTTNGESNKTNGDTQTINNKENN